MSSAAPKIGFVCSTYWPIIGGMEIYVHELAHALAERGSSVTVATRFTDERPGGTGALHRSVEPARRYREDAVEVHVVAPPLLTQPLLYLAHRLHYYPATQRSAAALFRAAFSPSLRAALDGCDVVHYSGTGRELLGFAAAAVAAEMEAPFVVTPHTHIGAWGDGPLDLALYRQADAVIALTHHEKAHLVDCGLDAARLSVLGHGVNVDGSGDGARFRAAHGIDGPLVLYLGRKAPYKGYPLLLRAARQVWEDVPDAHFAFVGPGDPSLEDDALRRIRSDARVHDTGRVSNQEREDAYAACDVFCLPSQAEAFGLSYLEAWYYGKPVVGLALPTLQELIGSADGGVLTEASPRAVAQALVDLLCDRSLRAAMGARGQHRAQTQTWSLVADQMVDIYKTLVPSTPQPDPHLSHQAENLLSRLRATPRILPCSTTNAVKVRFSLHWYAFSPSNSN